MSELNTLAGMTGASGPDSSVTIRRWRSGLVVVGLLLLVLGVYVLVDTVNPTRIFGLATWFVYALIVHDGIIAGITFGASFLLRRTGKKLPLGVLAIIQGALVTASIFAIIVVPLIYKKSIGTKNPTVLPLDYGPALIGLWIAIVVLTALVIVGYYALARRQKNRPSVSQ